MKFRNGIIIAMITFVAFIVTLALVINSKDTELISEDYYIQEKNFNHDYAAQQRAADYKNPIQINFQNTGIFFTNQSTLAIQMIDLSFVLMNNGKADFSIQNHDLGKIIGTEKLSKGVYEIQIRYKVGNEPFMQVISWHYK
jgi:hypothetical protein